MATVNIDVTDDGVLMTWDKPPNDLIAPRGQILFHGVDTIAAKDAANDSFYQLTCNFPDGFVWRLVSLDFVIEGSNDADFNDLGNGIRFEITTDGDLVRVGAVMLNQVQVYAGESAKQGFVWDPDITNKRMEFYPLLGDYSEPFQSNAATLVCNLVDDSSDATAAVDVRHRARFLMYDIDQDHASPLHTYLNTFGS